MAAKQDDYKKIMSDLKAGIYKPIYLLMGEEPYYIEAICNFIKENVLTEEEKDFNLFQLYGSETSMVDILVTARRFPAMAQHTVVIVKEAQAIKDFDNITPYVQKPQMSTILVFCYKYKKPDGRKKYISDIKNIGVVYESAKLYENNIPPFITNYLKDKKRNIDQVATQMLTSFLGTDLIKIVNELDKLIQIVGEGQTITPAVIEKYVGVSKDFNPYELNKALAYKDFYKANQIVLYFAKNPKTTSIQQINSALFTLFSNLIIYFYLPRNNDKEYVAKELGISPYFLNEYLTAAKNYSPRKTMLIISKIRECDARSKGVGQVSISDGELLKELVHFILY